MPRHTHQFQHGYDPRRRGPQRGGYAGDRRIGRDGGGRQQPADHLSSPYNFVPLSDEVFIPEWGEPSQDRPFTDAVSGELRLLLTAKSPLYIRGSDPKPEQKSDLLWGQDNPPASSPFGRWTEFYRDANSGAYTIPGTSLKGEIRNVLKIAGFGSIGYTDDDFISVRDLSDPRYTEKITRPGPQGSFEARVRGGWLTESPDHGPDLPEWTITPCKVARVEQCHRGSGEVGLEECAKLDHMALGRAMLAAAAKYRLWDEKYGGRAIKFDLEDTERDDGFAVHRHSDKSLFYAKATNLGTGRKTGALVFTGQSGPREQKQRDRSGNETGAWMWQKGSKHLEFIFFDEEPKPLPVAPDVQKKFKDTHPDGNEGWRYWRKKLERLGGKVPVFWIENPEAKRPEERIVSFGLAQMFRLPARNLHDAIPPQHTQMNRLDVADRLFGILRAKDALRGRVAFSALKLEGNNQDVRFSRVIKTVLGAPRPTFYPAYLEQPAYSLPEGKLQAKRDSQGRHIQGKDLYQTWLCPEVRIRGWKRYPVVDAPPDQPEFIRHEHPIPDGRNGKNYEVATAFRPVKAGATFTGSVRFHNLTRKELGALVWALTWGGNSGLRHSLGMGKSLGLGSCALEIDWSGSTLVWRGEPESEFARRAEEASQEATKRQAFGESCRDEFKAVMIAFTTHQLSPASERRSWLDTGSLVELLAMADPANAASLASHKQFPPLRSNTRGVLDFRGLKRGFILPRTTEIISQKAIEKRLITSRQAAGPDRPP